MKFLFDLFPVALFFVAIQIWDIFVATAVAIGATILQVGWLLVRRKKVQPMLWASLVIIVVFGGLTLYLRDKTFILWKPTVLYWLFGAVLAGGALLGRNLIRALLSEQMRLPDPIWARLNWSWVGFFAFMGLVNLYVAFNYSEKIWATFKLFGGMGLMFLFVVAQSLVLAKYLQDESH
ncbi:MAG: septation protein A [Betaproteobacteria bacterium]|nr:MAG: septation protein A [Betaproteobacteria bacterium]